MFKESIDDRLSLWAKHRQALETSQTPFVDVWEFWKPAPYIPYNNKIDPYNRKSWPSPWEIIVHNIYDDFTKAIMIGTTLKMTERFKNSVIQVITYIDKTKPAMYNIVNIDGQWLINYNDNGPVPVEILPEAFYLENLIELEIPR
jgi:hypothetical protein